MTDVPFPEPEITPLNKPFWDGLENDSLVLQRCAACRHVNWPPAPACTACLSPDIAWEPMSGEGTLFSYAIYHRAWHPAFAPVVPYNVALVELDEGPMLVSNVIDCGIEDLRVGIPVASRFRLRGGVKILQFTPAEAQP